MPIDWNQLTPTEGKGLTSKRGRTAVDLGPNPFLEKGWLQVSYDNQKDYDVPVAGGWETYTITKGKNAGQQGERLVGDAALVVKLLRAAAEKLGLGVTIEINSGKRKGQVVVSYMGIKRKAPRKPKVVEQSAE